MTRAESSPVCCRGSWRYSAARSLLPRCAASMKPVSEPRGVSRPSGSFAADGGAVAALAAEESALNTVLASSGAHSRLSSNSWRRLALTTRIPIKGTSLRGFDARAEARAARSAQPTTIYGSGNGLVSECGELVYGWVLLPRSTPMTKKGHGLSMPWPSPSGVTAALLLFHPQIVPRHLRGLLHPKNPQHGRRDVLQRAIGTQRELACGLANGDERHRGGGGRR